MGKRQRYRFCNNPVPSNEGRDCPGVDVDMQDCSDIEICPRKCFYFIQILYKFIFISIILILKVGFGGINTYNVNLFSCQWHPSYLWQILTITCCI